MKLRVVAMTALAPVGIAVTIAGCNCSAGERPDAVRSCEQAVAAVPDLCGGSSPNGCVTNIPCEGFTACDRCPRALTCASSDSLVGYPHLDIGSDGSGSCDAGGLLDSSVRDAESETGVDAGL